MNTVPALCWESGIQYSLFYILRGRRMQYSESRKSDAEYVYVTITTKRFLASVYPTFVCVGYI